MPLRSLIRAMAVTAVGAAAGLALAAPAWAASPAGDPPGANGTVKIDALQFDAKISNQPHVTCEFRVKLFNFDADERGNIVFASQPPSGQKVELLRRDNVLLSNDAASGGNPDPDEIYAFSDDDFDLSGLKLHDKQGYHIKLTIERIGAPGAGKHKVFWLKPCPPSKTSTPPPPSDSSSTGAGGGGQAFSASLPVTGAPAVVLAGVGMAMVAGGGALIFVRRRYMS